MGVDLGEVVVDAQVLVRPAAVDVLHVDDDLLAAGGEEAVRDHERVAVGVLVAVGGLLRDGTRPGAGEQGVSRARPGPTGPYSMPVAPPWTGPVRWAKSTATTSGAAGGTGGGHGRGG
ncbi:hypothetical protein [Nonomuraea rubra]|uniref:hypothetical protein n=1 Tax=Nonomuraea rubra TaxID=46180 RepID=UPI0031E9072C